MLDGFEIDMLSLGDADCIVLTQWTPYGPHRVLIDGGKAADAPTIREFLRVRNITGFWAVICTHLHNDHTGGLIELVKDKSITISNGWMHNIRNHVGPEALRRASSGSSSEADGVRQVIENTDELKSAFASRGLTTQEPFAGYAIAGYPSVAVLGPSLASYKRALQEFTKVPVPRLTPPPSFTDVLSALGGYAPAENHSGLGSIFAPPSLTDQAFPPPAEPLHQTLSSLMGTSPFASIGSPLPSLQGVLSDSSVKNNPKTQPFNNTSTVIGCIFKGHRYLFTGDAGADSLGRIPLEWKNLTWMQMPHHGSDGNCSKTIMERLCPKFAYISACGDSSHPSRAIVSGLVKMGAEVFSTHQGGHLWHSNGSVPLRLNYSTAVPMRGTGEPIPVIDWSSLVPGALR